MRRGKSLTVEQGNARFKFTLDGNFIQIRQTDLAPRRIFPPKEGRRRFYNVRRMGSMIKFKTQFWLPAQLAMGMKKYLYFHEKDKAFYFYDNGNRNKVMTIGAPTEENPVSYVQVVIENSSVLNCGHVMYGIRIKGRKMKKHIKRVFYAVMPNGNDRFDIFQYMYINCFVMMEMLQRIEQDRYGEYYFNID